MKSRQDEPATVRPKKYWESPLRLFLSPGRIFTKLLQVFARWSLMHPRLRTIIQARRGVVFTDPGSVFLGSDVYFDELFPTNITVGANVYMAEGVRVLAHFYETDMPPHIQSPGHVVIEDDVFLGFNVVIAAPVTIGRGAVIGSNSVVTKDVTPWTVNGGIPCKKIRDRKRGEVVKE